MRNFGILLVLIGVGYLVYTQGIPKLEEMRAAEEAAEAEVQQSSQCVSQARAVSRSFSRDIGQFSRPPIERELWTSFLLQTSGQLSAADSACSCPAEACASASAALLELRSLVNSLDAFVRSQGPPVTDAAARLDTVERMLDRAESQQG